MFLYFFLFFFFFFFYGGGGNPPLPQTIESVDEDTLEGLSLSYKQILSENSELISQISGPEIEGYLKDELVKNYFGPLFLSDENE